MSVAKTQIVWWIILWVFFIKGFLIGQPKELNLKANPAFFINCGLDLVWFTDKTSVIQEFDFLKTNMMPVLLYVLNIVQAHCWNAILGKNNSCMQSNTWPSIECH